MIKYGVEFLSEAEDRIVMYKSKDRARADAEAKADALQAGESVMLFYADCDSEGRLATNEFNVVYVWGKD